MKGDRSKALRGIRLWRWIEWTNDGLKTINWARKRRNHIPNKRKARRSIRQEEKHKLKEEEI